MKKVEKEQHYRFEKQTLLLHLIDLLWEEKQITETEKNKIKSLILNMQLK